MWNVVSGSGKVISYFEAVDTAQVSTINTLQQFSTEAEALAAALLIDPTFTEPVDPTPPVDPAIMENAVLKAQADVAFGQTIITQFAALNAVEGLSSADIESIAQTFQPIELLLLGGGIQAALDALKTVTPSSLVPQAVIDQFSAQMTGYLNS